MPFDENLCADHPQSASTSLLHQGMLEVCFAQSEAGIALLDADLRILESNQILADICKVKDLKGKNLQEQFPAMWPVLEPLCYEALAGESVRNREIHILGVPNLSAYWELSLYPLPGEPSHLILMLQNISSHKQTEAALKTRRALYALLAQSNRAVDTCDSATELFGRICALAVEIGQFRFAWIGVPQQNELLPVASSGNDEGYLRAAHITLEAHQGPTVQALRLGKPCIINDFLAAELTAPWHELAHQAGFAASAALPLKQRGEVIAILNLYADTAGFFSPEIVENLAEITRMLSMALDAYQSKAERQSAVEALQAAEAHYRKLFEYAPDGIVIADADSYYLDANPSICRLLGYTREEFIGLHASDIVARSENSQIAGALDQLKSSQDHDREWQFRHKDGTAVYAEVIATPMPDGRFLGMIRDITARKQAELRILQLNRVYTVLSEVNQAIVREKDLQTLLETICQIAVEKGQLRLAWIGLAEADGDQIALRASANATPETVAIIRQMIDRQRQDCQCVFTYHALQTGEHGVCSDIAQDPRAEIWRAHALERGYASMAALPLRMGGKVVGTFNLYASEADFFTPAELRLLDEMALDIGFAMEINEREDELRLRDRAIQSVSQGIVITDPGLPDNPVIFASPSFAQMTGYSLDEIIGRNCRFLQGKDTDPDAIEQIRQAIRLGRGCNVELMNYRKDGSSFWNNLTISTVLNEKGQITHFVGVQTDVTKRRQLEELYRQSQKMELLGQLAGGVAHDFNNLLTIINGYSELLLANTPQSDPRHELVQEILKAGEWSSSLTAQLLTFSRKQVVVPQVVNLNEVVRNTQRMLTRIIGEDIQFSTDLARALPSIKADPGQLGQIILNLVVNARDSMPKGGKLTVETSQLECSDATNLRLPELSGRRCVCLTVTDTGTGMSAQIKEHLFEPFFTTKQPGHGTGLGLAVVYGIVKESGGQIDVMSEPGIGTTFRIYLPALEGEATAENHPDAATAPRGSETVLLVEDEDALRALISFVLQEQGYQVLEARRGEEALRLAETQPTPVALLLTDVVMPGMGGRALAERLTSRSPGTRVLYMSGYTDDAVVRHGILHKHVHFLLKPFSPTTLIHKVRDVLDQPISP